jgi:hypothetical protein
MRGLPVFKKLKNHILIFKGSFLRIRLRKSEIILRKFEYTLSLFLGHNYKIILKNEVFSKMRIRNPSYPS